MPSLDNKSDVFDMNVFTRNWLWSSSSREFERINTNINSIYEHNVEFLKDENKISIIIPNDITSGRIQIDKSDINTKYKIENNIGNMLLLQDDHEFYQISFGNLSKSDGLKLFGLLTEQFLTNYLFNLLKMMDLLQAIK